MPNGILNAKYFLGDGSGLTGVTATSVAAANITAGTLAADVIASSIAVRVVGTEQLVDLSVTTPKLALQAVSNAQISNTAAIADTKLAQITTANKVADSALSANVDLLNANQLVS